MTLKSEIYHHRRMGMVRLEVVVRRHFVRMLVELTVAAKSHFVFHLEWDTSQSLLANIKSDRDYIQALYHLSAKSKV